MNIKSILLITLFLNTSILFAQKTVEKWKVFELSLSGPIKGNPFTDTSLSAIFINGNDTVLTKGFYDGDDIYKTGTITLICLQ